MVLLTDHGGAIRTTRRFYPTRPGCALPHSRRMDTQPRQSNRRQWIRISRCMAADVAIICAYSTATRTPRHRRSRRRVAGSYLAPAVALGAGWIGRRVWAMASLGYLRCDWRASMGRSAASDGLVRGRRPRRTGRPRRWSTPTPEPLRALRRSAQRRLRWPLRRPMPTPVRRLG